ncbi:MAG: hypothetical protein WD638_03110 [Nitriliruptoraceae bacterium]
MSEGAGAPGGPGASRAPRTSLLARWSLQVRRHHLGRLATVAIVAMLLGIGLGRATAPGPEADAQQVIVSSVLPIAFDADGIWTSSSEDRAPVSDALVALRRDGDPTLVREHGDAWVAAYDAAIVRLAAVDAPPTARSVQRQLISAVTLSRDAVEVLAHAAEVEDELLRRDLTTEVGRLRARSEQLTASARASASDLDGTRTDVSPLPPLRGFLDAR